MCSNNKTILLSQSNSILPSTGSYQSPTVLLDVQPSNDIWDDVLLGPLVKVASFRTAKEAVAIVNHSKQGVGCSVWSEKNSLIMQVSVFTAFILVFRVFVFVQR